MNKELMRDFHALMDGRDSLELDLSIPEHEAYFLKRHGGGKYLADKYPAVFNAYLKTKKSHCEAASLAAEGQRERDRDRDRERDRAGCEAPGDSYTEYIYPIEVLDLKSAPEKSCGDSVSPDTLLRSGVRTEVNASTGVIQISVTGLMENKKKEEAYDEIGEVYDYEELLSKKYQCNDSFQCYTSEVVSFEKETLTMSCEFEYVKADGTVITKLASKDYEVPVKASPYVKLLQVENPWSEFENDPIQVMYNTRSAYHMDYTYPENEVKYQQDEVKTIMPLSGSITFHDDYTPIEFYSDVYPLKLTYMGDDSVKYNNRPDEINQVFWIDEDDPQKVNFLLDRDWKVVMSNQKYNNHLTTSLSWTFRFKLKAKIGPDKTANIIIKSAEKHEGEEYYTAKDGGTVIIPYVYILWGCFGKDTRLRMADGSERLVDQIGVGDRLAVRDGGSAAVTEIVTGLEKRMIHVEIADGRYILLSDTHPLLTERGVVRAGELNAGDRLLMEDGNYEPVRYLYREEYNDKVYNFKLEREGHFVMANGFVSGDFDAQNSAPDRTALLQNGLDADVERLTQQFRALFGEMNQKQSRCGDKNREGGK